MKLRMMPFDANILCAFTSSQVGLDSEFSYEPIAHHYEKTIPPSLPRDRPKQRPNRFTTIRYITCEDENAAVMEFAFHR